MASPVLAGAIPRAGIVEKLTTIEAKCTTGVLRWRGSTEGELALVRGQIASEQPARADGQDPLELLLAERTGTFEVFQILPPLPVSKGKEGIRRGSLEVHVAADLMRYCENAGLTGVLVMEHDGRRAELGYACGELGDIRLDGLDELHEVFGWEDGSFEIVALVVAPNLGEDLEEAVTTEMIRPDLVVDEPKADSTGKLLLRVVEMTLAEIVREREERRPVTKTSPPVVPLAPPKKHPTLPPPAVPPKRTREPTVRVFYLKGDSEAPKDEGLRHVSSAVALEDELPEALPTRRSEPAPSRGAATESSSRSAPKGSTKSASFARPSESASESASESREPAKSATASSAKEPSAMESSASKSRVEATKPAPEPTAPRAAPARVTEAVTVKVAASTASPKKPGSNAEPIEATIPASTPAARPPAHRAVRDDETAKTTKERDVTTAPPDDAKPLPTAVWALISLLLVIGALVILSMLPALE